MEARLSWCLFCKMKDRVQFSVSTRKSLGMVICCVILRLDRQKHIGSWVDATLPHWTAYRKVASPPHACAYPGNSCTHTHAYILRLLRFASVKVQAVNGSGYKKSQFSPGTSSLVGHQVPRVSPKHMCICGTK